MWEIAEKRQHTGVRPRIHSLHVGPDLLLGSVVDGLHVLGVGEKIDVMLVGGRDGRLVGFHQTLRIVIRVVEYNRVSNANVLQRPPFACHMCRVYLLENFVAFGDVAEDGVSRVEMFEVVVFRKREEEL